MPIDQYELQRWLEMLDMQDWLQERYPAPEAPAFPSYPGLTGEQESSLLQMMQRGIQGQTNRTLGKVRTSAAQRGAYRSGQLARMETDVMKAGDRQYSEALLGYVTNKANSLQNWNLAKANYGLSAWQPIFQSWLQSMRGAGDMFGRVVR